MAFEIWSRLPVMYRPASVLCPDTILVRAMTFFSDRRMSPEPRHNFSVGIQGWPNTLFFKYHISSKKQRSYTTLLLHLPEFVDAVTFSSIAHVTLTLHSNCNAICTVKNCECYVTTPEDWEGNMWTVMKPLATKTFTDKFLSYFLFPLIRLSEAYIVLSNSIRKPC
jgi:hypothetical protein